ncbi:hypothetical protein [Shinella sp.]|uniref:hypothetical protein n=1 Tax=Shinella sp. TaxID=1870904 RepID=UPI00258FCE08|nr:hypothetical protein [Shinella sp.]MCW5706756.1 hypothetical protein [Shinella sp.]
MTSVIARILLRYLAAALVTMGVLDSEIGAQIGADPDLLMLLGMAIGLAVEMTYAAAKRLGWTT